MKRCICILGYNSLALFGFFREKPAKAFSEDGLYLQQKQSTSKSAPAGKSFTAKAARAGLPSLKN